MLTHAQEKLIRSLHDKKGRRETGLCLVEGQKNVAEAGPLVEFTFTRNDSPKFTKLVTTETPQDIAAVARIPSCTEEQLLSQPALVILDGVQDPGNVGTILRLCLGFSAALLLVESADPANSKTIRASAGAMFQVPWETMTRPEAEQWLVNLLQKNGRTVYRLENAATATPLEHIQMKRDKTNERMILIAGSEGHGIDMNTPGTSLAITTNPKLESLNVSVAVGITLHHLYLLSL